MSETTEDAALIEAVARAITYADPDCMTYRIMDGESGVYEPFGPAWMHHESDAEKAIAAVRAYDAAAGQPVTLTYTNWRGETAAREIMPQRMWFGSTEWHPDPQWLISGLDVEKGAARDFALSGFGNRLDAQATDAE